MNTFALLGRSYRVLASRVTRYFSTIHEERPDPLVGIPPSLSEKLRKDPTLFRPSDFVIIRENQKGRRSLVGPLTPGATRDTAHGKVAHNDIIGKMPRSGIKTHRGTVAFTAHHPTLDEYILNAPRICTPIYPKDAAMIISFLDLHPGSQILEAGTGNGALTLYLARAIASHASDSSPPSGQVHTIELRADHAAAARRHLLKFHRGAYAPHVCSHVGACDKVLREHYPSGTPFDAAVLDMPEPWESLKAVVPRLKNDGFLVCYLPNMTQVLDLVRYVRFERIPVAMEQCVDVELKEWDVRATVVRSRTKTTQEVKVKEFQVEEDGEDEEDEKESGGPALNAVVAPAEVEPALAWVCRPKNYNVHGHTAFLVKFRKCERVIEEEIEKIVTRDILQEDEPHLDSLLNDNVCR
ncbi:S-adenosyl-L-methionine-dependent methyltransferase [Endogone sp. FLAS-F59071]|nr:S-adenosyl-L-methionine-dependent methyltransferase [Endogone sp. FLAS-F59071]|eukprot:RUS23180.1 S-adenosyl-L-methionine-dependent methyltransferase [Endogone sp. FLAS-F59071]